MGISQSDLSDNKQNIVSKQFDDVDDILPSIGSDPRINRAWKFHVINNKTFWFEGERLVCIQNFEGIAWIINNEIRRVDRPNGQIEYYFNNELHHQTHPAIISSGSNQWWNHGEKHRENLPAVNFADGTREWWYHGLRHRNEGPAVENPDGKNQWWLYGKKMSEQKFLKNNSKKPSISEIQPIDQGTYGCIYRESLECKNQTYTCENCVTKKFKNRLQRLFLSNIISDYEAEIESNEIVDSIDPDGKYHFRMLHNCDSSIAYNANCGDPVSPLIFYERGEESLATIMKNINRNNLSEILLGLMNLFEGLIYFQSKQFYHMDIKPENIIRDRPPKKKYRFVDFGLSKTLDQLLHQKNEMYDRGNYCIWPPEIVLFGTGLLGINEIEIYTEKYFQHCNSRHPSLSKIEIKNTLIQLIKLWKNQKLSIAKNIADKIDVYSLGMLIYDFYRLSKKIGQYSEILENIYDLSINMTLINSSKRYSAMQARDRYAKILQDANIIVE